MKTIKLPYQTTEDLTCLLKQYSNVVRYSYNRLLEGKSEKDIRLLSKSLNSIDLLNSWMIQCGIRDAGVVYKRFGKEKVVFGGKLNFSRYLNHKISKETFKKNRLLPLTIQGEKLVHGNRSFNLDIIENNCIILKLNRSKHIVLQLPKLRNSYKKDLFKLQELNEKGTTGYTYTVKLDLDNIYISFEEFKEVPVKLNENRSLGIDMNPDSIGISILDSGNIIHTEEFSLKLIFIKVLDENNSSASSRMKYLQNKLKFETFEISKSIATLAKRFHCKTVFIEDLKFKGSLSNHVSNRKNKNLWKRNLFLSNLTKRLNISNIKIYSINPAYTSFIGNMVHDFTDPVNASIEVARRGFEMLVKRNKNAFYPALLTKQLWKNMVVNFKSWKEFFLEVKNLKLKYRVSLEECKHSFKVFQQSSIKSGVIRYQFYA